jgi:phosphate starvation-inducible PhoH-like protein
MTEKLVKITSPEKIAQIFGDFDTNTKIIESEFGVRLFQSSEGINVIGDEPGAVENAASAIESLLKLPENEDMPSEQAVRYVISMVNSGSAGMLQNLDGDCICVTSRGRPVKAKTVGQKQYVDSIASNTLTIAVGPAGTGKTFLAVAMAVNALRAKQVNRIILTRPAVEAGERLGFLPGDLQSKIDPYLRPLYDALFLMLGMEGYTKNLEKGAIEIAPLAYMRGRTLDDSFIILDEAQNTTPEQMKMFLTRLGFGSKVVVTGDITQIDLPKGIKSGLTEAVKILDGIPGISVFKLTSKDIVRHSLVQKIINAYEKYENGKMKGEE